ncbi:hypothetical protein AB0A73_08180 [Glycomyces sp. NPDC047369]
MTKLVIELQQEDLRSLIGGRTAVLVSLAGWPTGEVSLRDWMADRLSADFGMSKRVARSLVDQQLIMPVFDTLDEACCAELSSAVGLITEYAAPGTPLVLASQDGPYRQLIAEGNELAGALSVEINPLEPWSAIRYLDPKRSTRWREVRAAIDQGSHSAFAEVLSSTLYVTLMRDVYRAEDSDPSRMLKFSSSDEIKEDLTSELIPNEARLNARARAAGYRPSARRRARTSRPPDEVAARVASVLRFVLRRSDEANVPDLAWWKAVQLLKMTERAAVRVAAAAAFAGASGLAMVFSHLLAGDDWEFARQMFPWGALPGAVSGLLVLPGPRGQRKLLKPSRLGYGTKQEFFHDLCLSLIGGVMSALLLPVSAVLSLILVPGSRFHTEPGWLLESIRGMAVFAAVVAMIIMILSAASPSRRPEAQSPQSSLAHDQRALAMRFIGLAVAVTVILSFRGAAWLAPPIVITMSALLLRYCSWWNFKVTNLYLTLRGRLPWDYMKLLAEAHRLRVLRISGSTFLVRHEILRKYLLRRDDGVEGERRAP